MTKAKTRLLHAGALLLLGALTSTGCGSGSSDSSSNSSTTTTLAASSLTTTAGADITLTATVSPSAATGTVTFYDGTTSLGTEVLSSGTATLTTSALAVGTHALTALYGGSTTHDTSTSSSVIVSVTAATTGTTTITLAASPTSVTVGSGVALTVVVSPITSTGTVTFYDGTNSLGTATLVSGSATATLTTTALAVGSHTITAGFSSSTSNPASVAVTTASSGSWSAGACGRGTGANVLSSGTLAESSQRYSASSADESAICLTGTSSYLTLIDPAITTSGSASSSDDSSFYGLDAAVLDYNGGNLVIEGGTISTSGSGGNVVFSYGTGAVTISNATVAATGSAGHGLYAAGGGTMIVNNVTASSEGSSGSIVATDRGGGTITITGGKYTTHGQRSAGIYSTGTVTATNATFDATNAEAMVIEGSNIITLIDSTLTATSSTSEHRGIFLYQSMSGDASNSDCGTGACFSMTGGSFDYTDTTNSSATATDNCSAFTVANQVAHFVLTDVTINNTCPTLLLSALNSNWNYKGGTTTFKAYGETLAGNVIVDSVSTADIHLYSSPSTAAVSQLTGAINSANSGSTKVDLTLDSSSQWVVTENSHLTALNDADTSYSNITKNCTSCSVYVGSTVIK